jgi:uncharacterized protein (DUF1330 family)
MDVERSKSHDGRFACAVRRCPLFGKQFTLGTDLIFYEDSRMTKAYWITCYRNITDPLKLAAYAKLAGPAIEAGGGRFLARGVAAKSYEDGLMERIVLIEFDSLERAIATHDSPGYGEALAALDGGAVRDIRMVQGV